jgi:hypothetical protein
VLEGLARTAVTDHEADHASSQAGAGPGDHEHTPSGITVVHNGVGPADPMDALPTDVLFPEPHP